MNERFEKFAEIKLNLDSTLKKLSDFKEIQKDPLNYVYDYLDDLLNKLQLRKEEIIESINNYFEPHLDKLESLKKEYKNESKGKVEKCSAIDISKIENELELIQKENQGYQTLPVKYFRVSHLEAEIGLLEANVKILEIRNNLDNYLKELLDKESFYLTPSNISLRNYKHLFGELKHKQVNNMFFLFY
jgi:hypothetical protein